MGNYRKRKRRMKGGAKPSNMKPYESLINEGVKAANEGLLRREVIVPFQAAEELAKDNNDLEMLEKITTQKIDTLKIFDEKKKIAQQSLPPPTQQPPPPPAALSPPPPLPPPKMSGDFSKMTGLLIEKIKGQSVDSWTEDFNKWSIKYDTEITKIIENILTLKEKISSLTAKEEHINLQLENKQEELEKTMADDKAVQEKLTKAKDDAVQGTGEEKAKAEELKLELEKTIADTVKVQAEFDVLNAKSGNNQTEIKNLQDKIVQLLGNVNTNTSKISTTLKGGKKRKTKRKGGKRKTKRKTKRKKSKKKRKKSKRKTTRC